MSTVTCSRPIQELHSVEPEDMTVLELATALNWYFETELFDGRKGEYRSKRGYVRYLNIVRKLKERLEEEYEEVMG